MILHQQDQVAEGSFMVIVLLYYATPIKGSRRFRRQICFKFVLLLHFEDYSKVLLGSSCYYFVRLWVSQAHVTLSRQVERIVVSRSSCYSCRRSGVSQEYYLTPLGSLGALRSSCYTNRKVWESVILLLHKRLLVLGCSLYPHQKVRGYEGIKFTMLHLFKYYLHPKFIIFFLYDRNDCRLCGLGAFWESKCYCNHRLEGLQLHGV